MSRRTRRTNWPNPDFYLIGMKRGTYVRLIPSVCTPDAAPGFADREPKPLPPYRVGHWLEGYLEEDIGLTGQICFGRHLRNGKEVVRVTWRSSPICLVLGDQVFCQRAIYRLLKVPPFDADRSLQAWDESGEV